MQCRGDSVDRSCTRSMHTSSGRCIAMLDAELIGQMLHLSNRAIVLRDWLACLHLNLDLGYLEILRGLSALHSHIQNFVLVYVMF